MTAPYLAHPLRVGYDGRMVTVEPGTDDDIAQQVHIIAATRLGERPMALPFGVPQPSWDTLTAASIQAVIDVYGPAGVTVNVTGIVPVSEAISTAVVEWSR